MCERRRIGRPNIGENCFDNDGSTFAVLHLNYADTVDLFHTLESAPDEDRFPSLEQEMRVFLSKERPGKEQWINCEDCRFNDHGCKMPHTEEPNRDGGCYNGERKA